MKTDRTDVDESAKLFEAKLEPMFNVIAAGSQHHVMDKLSLSLKKALLMMAMERYGCHKGSICRGLGISRAKLEHELNHCGLRVAERKAA